MDYDPLRSPDPAAWLAMDEDERRELVHEAHVQLGIEHVPVPNLKLHAAMHVVAETQVALGEPPAARAALERLLHEGLDRHEAIHAIASASVKELANVLGGKGPVSLRQLTRNLDALTARSWSKGSSPGEDRALRSVRRRARRDR